MLFKKNILFSIILLLSCIFVSLIMSNIPFIIKYSRRTEGMTQPEFEDINDIDVLNTLQNSINGISDNVVNMNNLVKSNLNAMENKKDINTFNDNINKNIKLIDTGIENIDVPDIQNDLSEIMKKYVPSLKEKKKNMPEDYENFVEELSNEIKSINQKITDKKQNMTNKASLEASKKVSESKEMGDNVSAKNPLQNK